MADFDFAYAYIAPNEGGWSDHPLDKGGPTNFGITMKAARAHGYDFEDLKAMTREQAKEIYRADYWFLDAEPSNRVAAKVFDIAVNMGPGVGKKFWESIPQGTEEDEALTMLVEFCRMRYQSIIDRNPSQKVFEKGWMKRAERIP